MDSSKSVSEIPLHFAEKEEVKVVNSYLSIPVTSFEARKIEQVHVYDIPP